MAASLPSLDPGAFREPPSRLFLDYLGRTGRAAEFFAGDWGLEGLAAAARRVRDVQRPRETVAAALVRQQKERGAELAARNAARLSEPQAVAVVTGQQAVLFGGPALVLYKAVAALRVARDLETRLGSPVVPVFWVASDDHDFEEIRKAELVDATGALRALRYAPAQEPAGAPASSIELDASIGSLLDELQECLADTPARQATLFQLRECYRPGATLASAFARLISSLLPSLVVLDPADPILKGLMAPVLRREIEGGSPSSRAAMGANAALEGAGYHEQVAVREGFLNAFVIEDGKRRALALRDGALEVRGSGRRLSVADAVAWLEREPAAWSPGALLRPIAQDALLPTAAYVGGPAEIAYHAQIGPAYAAFDVPRPALVPRPGATLVEPSQLRALEAEGLELLELQQEPDALLERWARAAHPAVDAAFASARNAIEGEMLALADALGAADPTLRAAAESAKGRALFQLEGLHEKATRALKKRDQQRALRLRRTREALFPGGVPQERRIAFVSWLARWGDAVVDVMRERLDPFAASHQVITL